MKVLKFLLAVGLVVVSLFVLSVSIALLLDSNAQLFDVLTIFIVFVSSIVIVLLGLITYLLLEINKKLK